MRGSLSLVSTLCEAKFYRMVLENVNWRVARYMFFMMLASSGMWNASVGMSILLQSWSMLPDAQCCMSAFLPSTFAMYFVTLASAFNMEPSSSRNPQRTLLVTALFAAAAVVGWSFDLALSPFILWLENSSPPQGT